MSTVRAEARISETYVDLCVAGERGAEAAEYDDRTTAAVKSVLIEIGALQSHGYTQSASCSDGSESRGRCEVTRRLGTRCYLAEALAAAGDG